MRIEATVFSFDPVWQKDLTAKAYAALCALYPAGSAERRDSAERLFALNRGALRQREPLTVRSHLGDDARAGAIGCSHKIRHPDLNRFQDGGNPFRVGVRLSGGAAACTLSDYLRGTVCLQDGASSGRFGHAMSASAERSPTGIFSLFE
jgi:hypothetical protein